MRCESDFEDVIKAATGRTKDKADWELLQHDVGQKGVT